MLSTGSHHTVLDLDGANPTGVSFDRTSNRLWFYDWNHDSTDGTWLWLYRLDWQNQKAIPIIAEASDFDFSPHRKIYAAVATRRLADYTKTKSVWVAKAWVGNWETGKSWTIVGGLAYAISIAVRP